MLNTILGILFFLVAITIIVVIHEFGHLIVAKRNGVKCFEFSIGMGPKLFKLHTDKQGTVYNVRAIPIGGYVMMAGEEEAPDMEFDKEESLVNKHPWQKIKILFAGAIMNFILGWVVLFISMFFFGIQTPVDSGQVVVQENSPAATAGLATGDTITKIDGTAVNNYDDITTNLANKKTVSIEYTRSGQTDQTSITKKQLNCETAIIGISPVTESKNFQLSASVKGATHTFGAIAGSIGDSLNMLFNGTAGVSDLMGPVGLASASKSVVTQGLSVMLMTIAFLSINIGFVNILPFPALDGGRIVLAFIELITRRRVPEKFEQYLNLIGFLLLMGLFVVVTFSDVGRIGTASYYDMAISSDTVCAQDSKEVQYTFNFDQIGEDLPKSVSVDLKVSDGVITNVNNGTSDIKNNANTIKFDYDSNTISNFATNDITVTVKPDSSATKPLDLVVKVHDENGDTINQAIYRIDR